MDAKVVRDANCAWERSEGRVEKKNRVFSGKNSDEKCRSKVQGIRNRARIIGSIL